MASLINPINDAIVGFYRARAYADNCQQTRIN